MFEYPVVSNSNQHLVLSVLDFDISNRCKIVSHSCNLHFHDDIIDDVGPLFICLFDICRWQ